MARDFNRMKPGDVLVATTTATWTPLFAMASAVVTDIGGPSAIALSWREYGIRGMATGVATARSNARSSPLMAAPGWSRSLGVKRMQTMRRTPPGLDPGFTLLVVMLGYGGYPHHPFISKTMGAGGQSWVCSWHLMP
jgi:hypothetical protein